VGSSRVDFDSSQAVGPCAGIKAAAGSATVTCGNTAADASGADLVVVVAGLTPMTRARSTRSGDRTSFALDGKDNGKGNAGVQNKLITDVVALGKPVVVVPKAGASSICLGWPRSRPWSWRGIPA